MDVLLLNPPYSENVYEFQSVVAVKPPLGLAYIASALENVGFEIQILDANAEGLSIMETVEKTLNSGAKIIGITAVTTTIPIVFKICTYLKARRNDAIVVVGGPHVTFTARRTLEECEDIDIIVRNEGEEAMAELVPVLLRGGSISGINGVTYRDNNQIVHNPDRELIKNISAMPFPARHLLPIENYHPSSLFNLGVRGSQYTTIISTRGCPNRCTYCSSSHFWKKLRKRSPENVIDEIIHLVRSYDVKQIDFLDDTIAYPISRLVRICDLIIQNGIKIKWACYSRVDTLTEEAVRKMKQAGCFAVQFGIESGNQDILKGINKNITLQQVRNSVKLVKKYGLKVMGDFMIGLPGDTKKTVQQTINFAKELGLNLAFFSVTTPFPGTELYNDALNRGIIRSDHSWDEMTLHKATSFSTDELSAGDLKQLYKRAIREFHFRPQYWVETLKWVAKNPYDVKNYAALAWAFVRNKRKLP